MIAEKIRLADGEADQGLIPGVEPVAVAKHDCQDLQRARDRRRTHAPMSAGGLFDDAARAQASLF